MKRINLVTTSVVILSFITISGLVVVATKCEPSNSFPDARFGHSMVYDVSNEQVILFGGSTANDGRSSLDDTWVFNCSSNTWEELSVTSKPSNRMGHSMVYDSINQQVILFGGWSDETWIFDPQNKTWTDVTSACHPSARQSAGMYFDPVNEKAVLFGGYLNDDSQEDDTWIFDPVDNTWIEVFPPSEPAAIYGHSMVYDSVNQRGLLFGGRVSALQSETWAYNYSSNSWTLLHPTQKPVARYWHDATFDTNEGNMVIFGGDDQGPGRARNDIWMFDVQNDQWTVTLPESQPVPRSNHAIVYDSLNQRVILFGGLGNDYSDVYGDNWAFDCINSNWIDLNETISSETSSTTESEQSLTSNESLTSNTLGYDNILGFAGFLSIFTFVLLRKRKKK